MNYIDVNDGIIDNVLVVNEDMYTWAAGLGFIPDPEGKMAIGDSYVNGVWTRRDDTGN